MLGEIHQYQFSQRSSYLKRSVMRDLLKHAVDPNIISLAGGLPADECLPTAQLQACMNMVIERDGAAAYQYSPQYTPLRQWLADYMNERGVNCTVENIFITNGNQQALGILSRLFLDEGDIAVIEEAVFTGIQQGTKGVGAQVITVPTDLETGVDVDALEQVFSQHDVKFAVLIPDFHNPLGISMTPEKRQRVAELASRYGVPIAEDDAYSQLRFKGGALAPIASYQHDDYVFYMGSFSKMLAPSLRMGWMVIPEQLLPKVTVLRESIDLETSTLTQRTVAEFLQRGYLPEHLTQLNAEHEKRANKLMDALNNHLADIASWVVPEGGLFTWLTLPPHINTWDILQNAIDAGVVYIPGGAFALDGSKTNTMRLNFSKVATNKVEEGIARLSEVIHSSL